MIRRLLILPGFFIFSLNATTQIAVRFQVDALPAYHIADNDLYLAGSFNGWNPGDSLYRFQRDGQGHYFINKTLPIGSYEYKITRGGWDRVECAAGGMPVNNRVLSLQRDTTILLRIQDWSDHFQNQPRKSTASPRVRIMDTAFAMNPLERRRRIWIYLPAGYEGSDKRYPVLYMQDGQNLFEDSSSYAGEWGVDEFLDSTRWDPCIVVGIDNGGLRRMNEYNPYEFDRFGKGRGAEYAAFMALTLKPYIDRHYRTLADPTHTFIAGSSMGGLISFYALLRYPDVFGAAGVFSPAFWTAPGLAADIRDAGAKFRGRIFFYAGSKEGENMVPDMEKIIDTVKQYSKAGMKELVDPQGLHNEPTWRSHFPAFYQWLVGEKDE